MLDADDETVTQHFVGKVTLIAGLNQAIECHNVLFHGFIYLLSLSVKASSLENNVSSNAQNVSNFAMIA